MDEKSVMAATVIRNSEVVNGIPNRNSGPIRGMRPVETIGDRIKRARQGAKIKQKALADAVGLSPGTLADLESGRSQNTTKLHRIANELGVHIEWLESGKGPPSRTDVVRHLPVDKRQQVIDPVQKKVIFNSRLLRLDPVMIRDGFTVVANFFEAAGGEFRVDVDPDLMARAYEWAQSGDPALLTSIDADVRARIEERRGTRDGAEEAAGRRGPERDR